MGLTIHYQFVREAQPENFLKMAEDLAKQLGFKILERSWNKLIVHPSEDCETIDLHFHKAKTIRKREGYDYEKNTISKELEENEWYCGGFVKTHYAGAEVHILVANFLRFIASNCYKSEVSDESDFYERGNSEESIQELKDFLDDYNVSIGKITGVIKEHFGKDNVIAGGDL